MKKPSIRPFVAMLALVFSLSQTPVAMAASNYDLKAAIDDTVWYDATDYASQCTQGSATNGPASIAGHTLPATHGGAGNEESINDQGRVISTGQQVSFWQNAKLGQNFRDYYITMRWRYSLWNWNGTSGGKGPEDVTFYSQAPRVLVTNPRTGKSIIAAILESGPGPWTGVIASPTIDPKTKLVTDPPQQGWANPQDGTPAAYKGRVAGFPPVAKNYLGFSQRMADGSGDDLLYSWAPDQNAQPGPYTGAVTTASGSATASDCSSADNSGTLVGIADVEFKKNVVTAIASTPKGPKECNCGGRIDVYTNNNPEEWCADFVSWVYMTAGTPFKAGSSWKISYVPTLISYFQNLGPNHFFPNRPSPSSTPPQPGDVIFFNWSGASTANPSNGDHTGIIETVNATTGIITTIEGNAGHPSGVRQESYNYVKDTVVLGWGRL